ncbi:Beta-lactamase [Streptomyces sp. di188]|nr:Beta-lactamase [Streptomyces sp. di50b]SCE47438.1 Beta-lactamase [Streptomyces sp. di188]
MESDTLWRIYSLTKPVTTVAALMLVEDGLLSLDDEVGRHLATTFWVDPGRDLTVRFSTQVRPRSSHTVHRDLERLVHEALAD